MKTFLIDALWLLSGAAWLPLYAAVRLLGFDPRWLRRWGNRVDNLPDALKEFLHCHRIPFTDYQLNIAFMMKNRGRPYWPVIRSHTTVWGNCDPEDYKGVK